MQMCPPIQNGVSVDVTKLRYLGKKLNAHGMAECHKEITKTQEDREGESGVMLLEAKKGRR